MKQQTTRPRNWFLIGGILAIAALLLVRLIFLQIVDHRAFLDKADRQYTSSGAAPYERGSVYFTNKDGSSIAAASIRTGYVLAADPSLIKDPNAVFSALGSLLGSTVSSATGSDIPFTEEGIVARLSKPNDHYEELAHRVDDATAAKIIALSLPGISLYREQWRYYPQGTLASQVVGFVGYDDTGKNLTGRYGLENFYNDILSRTTIGVYTNFFAQLFSDLKTTVTSENQEGDVATGLEPTVESYLETELKKVNDTYSSTMTGGIIIDPKTGQIYAMASYPTYDPNSYQSQKSAAVYVNQLVEGVYEMGSIIKPLTMAAGIDSGAVTPTSTYDDKGFITLSGFKISNYDGRGRGPQTSMQLVLNDSLNTGAAYVALKMGNEKFSQYMKNYGIGTTTGIDLPHEAHGLIANLDSPRDVEHATASFGQGIAMTPIETARALCVLANGGYLVTPHVATQINYVLGLPKVVSYPSGPQVIKPETSRAISNMLITVVDKALLNGAVKMDGYTIAAKTGTAQMSNPATGKYYADRYLHSFFGYFPAYNPRFLVFLYTVYPKGVQYASHTLTIPFSEIAKFLISYYQIPPDR